MKVRTKLVSNLTPEEYSKCKSLNLRDRGEMFYALPRARYNGSRAILIEENNKLLAWALLIPKNDGGFFWEGQFYVRHSARRRGLGTKLINKALKLYPDLKICPHNLQSSMFFASIPTELATSPEYSYWGERMKSFKRLHKP